MKTPIDCTVEGVYYDYNGIWKIVVTTGKTKKPRGLKVRDEVMLTKLKLTEATP